MKKIFEKLYNEFKENRTEHKKELLAFLTVFFSMVINHIVFFVHNWANEDSLYNLIVEESMVGSGRFMPGNVLSKFASPMVLFVIATVALGLVSIMLVKMFKLEKKSHIVLVSILLTSFPVLAMSFGYNFMIERYMMGLLLAVLAVFLTDKWTYGFILGGLCLGASLGYYQSYITVSITLIIIKIILKLFEESDLKKIGIYIGQFLLMGIIGVGLYFIVIKWVYGLLGIELLDYKGIDNIGLIPSISKWPRLILKTYGHVATFVLGIQFFKPGNISLILQVLLAISNIFLVVLALVKIKNLKKANIVLIVLFSLLLPFGMNALDFMMDDVSVSTLNIYQFIFIFIIPFVLISFLGNKVKDVKLLNIVEVLCVVCTVGVIWSNFKITNLYYTKMQSYNEASVLLTNRIYSRIEGMPDVTSETKIFFGNRTGIYDNANALDLYSDVFLMDQGLWGQYIGYSSMPGYSDYKYHVLINNLIGVSTKQITYEDGEKIKSFSIYEEMPTWPAQGSIGYIDDVLVVKLS